MGTNSNALVHTESAWVDRLFSQSEFSPQYQDLKFILHRKLLDRINLEMLSSVAVDRVRSEVRSAVARLVQGVREGAAQYPDFGRYRRRKNHPFERDVQLHLRR